MKLSLLLPGSRPAARRLVSGTCVLGLLLAAAPAFADVQACLAASEKGQRARSAGKLREARDHFLTCGQDACPTLVRQDCAQWNAELARTLPTVVFGARDAEGRDLFDVTVTMDGEPLVTKLDGKSVTVDPGKHTFRFETQGHAPVTETALVKEGERARLLDVTFPDGGAAATSSPSSSPATVTAEPSVDARGPGHTPYPWIVVGAGAAAVAAGAVIVLTAPDRPSNCNEATQTCTPRDGQSREDFRADQERAGTADSQPLLGYVVAAAGLALVAGGLAWHFLEPTGSEKASSALRVMPWTTGRSSGLSLGARF